ncbi:MAG TPA: hypothetical protein VMA95_11060 [Streptosporangiaceae bacterium]|nr:hypothetical protein [Streptosporangiaceae bacterium]
MSGNSATPRWRVLFTPRWLSWHLFAVVAFIGMWWLGDWQFHRALDGNALSWAYTFEWPIFAIFGAVFWVKTVRDELHPPAPGEAREVPLPSSVALAAAGAVADGIEGYENDEGISGLARVLAGDGDEDQDDEHAKTELAEYNAYLARLNKEVKGHGRWHGLR